MTDPITLGDRDAREKIARARQSVDAVKGPQELTPQRPKTALPQRPSPLRPETLEQVKALEVASTETPKVVAEERSQDEDEGYSKLAAALNLGGVNEAELILNNKKRRREIEARCEPMNVEDLLYKGEVRQAVPILPGKFEVVFRSTTSEESLFLKKYLAREQSPNDGYTVEKYALCQLCCALVSISGAELPSHIGKDGHPDEKDFDLKLSKLLKMSGYVLADLGVNFVWFDMRVRKLLTQESLGNGSLPL